MEEGPRLWFGSWVGCGGCHTSGARAGPGGSGHCPAPKMANLLLLQPEPSMPNTALLIKNPLAATHEFKQACQLCYPKTGKATPPCSTPLPRDGRGLRSIESQNDRTPVHPSERSLGRQKPCWLFILLLFPLRLHCLSFLLPLSFALI